MNGFKPMKAVAIDLSMTIDGYVSPKLDGIRVALVSGNVYTKSMKNPPNRHITGILAKYAHLNLDGEVIVGQPTDDDIYRKTSSAVMSKTGEPDFTYYVFDIIDPTKPFVDRRLAMLELDLPPFMKLVEQVRVFNVNELLRTEKTYLDHGYEGLMYRRFTGGYKFGRSTVKEAHLLKLKRFSDAEALITGVEEMEHNGNEAFTAEDGRTKRSSHQENKSGLGTLGNFICETPEGVKFRIGIGENGSLTMAERDRYWAMREQLPGKHIKYKFFDVGNKDAPRHPKFISLIDPVDM